MTMVNSETHSLEKIFSDKYKVDFYQREYVWEKKHIEDLVMDLSTEFLKNWKRGDIDVNGYDPYFMGEIVLSVKDGTNYIIDGQQRITTLTLLLIYIINQFKDVPDFPLEEITPLIYKQHQGVKTFNLQIEERTECMEGLFKEGEYKTDSDDVSINNILERYEDFEECWNDNINEENINMFVYWIMYRVMFSKVWTDSDSFAYVIFETMNDRGLSLTQIEMLRSYMLANIDESDRNSAIELFDEIVKRLSNIKLATKSKAEFEFFKFYFRGHYAESFNQKDNNSDFVMIGQAFHRWVRDNEKKLNLKKSDDYVDFLQRIDYFSKIYEKINDIVQKREENINDYLYLIVNSDYGFSLQPALLMSSIEYGDSEKTVMQKLQLVSKYLTRVLTWRVWCHYVISQSSLEAPIYNLCKEIRDKDINVIRMILEEDPLQPPDIEEHYPVLNQQNGRKLRVLLALITAIISRESEGVDYLIKAKPKDDNEKMEIEHIWANHPEQHSEIPEIDFANVRNTIGDLLLLPRPFNESYGDLPYKDKLPHYYSQNILAQTLDSKKYENSPGFVKFRKNSGLDFKPYDTFTEESIDERTDLYRDILMYNWK